MSGPDDLLRALAERISMLERLSDDRWVRLDRTLARLEEAIDRMDRRMWLAASACAAGGVGVLGALAWRALGA